MQDIRLSTGRVAVHNKEPDGSTFAKTTPGDPAFTRSEINEYKKISLELVRAGEKIPHFVGWRAYLI